jgi:NAD+ synthase
MDYNKVSEHIVNWLNNYLEENSLDGFTLGVSGGIDSSVVSTLCAMTGKPLLILKMPIHQMKLEVDIANKHIEYLENKYPNVSSETVDLSHTFNVMNESLGLEGDKANLSLANTRSRLRMATLYAKAIMKNYIVCGTGNKVEDFGIGFFTKGGDGTVDISPIGELLKSEVYSLGKSLGLIPEVLAAVPTDGLWAGSPTDEDQIGATYDELEWAMDFTSKYNGVQEGTKIIYDTDTLNISDRQLEVLNIYNHRHITTKHKMEMPPICGIPENLR